MPSRLTGFSRISVWLGAAGDKLRAYRDLLQAEATLARLEQDPELLAQRAENIAAIALELAAWAGALGEQARSLVSMIWGDAQEEVTPPKDP